MTLFKLVDVNHAVYAWCRFVRLAKLVLESADLESAGFGVVRLLAYNAHFYNANFQNELFNR